MNPLARPARHLTTGNRIVLQQLRQWLFPGQIRTTAARLAALGIAAAFTLGMALALHAVLYVVAALWGTAAYRAGRAQARAEDAEAALVQLVADAIGPRNGVLLADVLLLLHRDRHLTHWTVTDLRQGIERLGIPVRPSLKVGDKVSIGIHRDDLHSTWDVQPTPSPAPSGTPSGTGSSPGQPTTTPPPTPTPEGVSFTMQPPAAVAADTAFEDHLTDALNLLRGDR